MATRPLAESFAIRSLRRLPLLRAYPALLDARDQIRRLHQQAHLLERDLTVARQLATQHELALRSSQVTGSPGLVALPAFDEGRLAEIARARASAYRSARPFPHLVEDGLFDAGVLERVMAEFDLMDRSGWDQVDATQERKTATNNPRQLGPFASSLIAQLNGGAFLNFLENLTGITGLVSDPHLRGGGLHEIRRGGTLGVHADFNLHPRLKLYRRLNLLIYLNKDWNEAWGGALELWDGQRCVRAISPLFNRAVLFDTSNFSYHGHPHALDCPPDRSRKSVALYYYSLECPSEADRTEHGTVFLK